MSSRFRALCRGLAFGVWGALALLLAGLAFIVAVPAAWMPGLTGDVPPPLALWQHLALGVLVVGVAAPMVLALLAMRRLFANYGAGRVFDVESAATIGRIGVFLALGTAAKIAAQPVGSALLTLSLPQGQRTVALGLSSEDLVLGLLALLLIVIGRAMTEAVRIEADHRSII